MVEEEPNSGQRPRRIRRVVIEESHLEQRQRKTIEHARAAGGFAEDVDPHAHDEATFKLIRQWKDLNELDHAAEVMPILEKWKHWTRMNDWPQRNALIERLTGRMRRREATPAEVEILLVICRPAWMATLRELWRYGGVDVDPRAAGVHRREEAKRVAELDRDHLSQVVQEALLDALGNCPQPFPRRFFGWLKIVLAHRALDYVRCDLTESTLLLPEDRGIADVLEAVFADEQASSASYRSMGSPAYRQWVQTLDLPRLFEISAEYAGYARTRSACERAVERLPSRQRQVVQKHYFEAMTHEQIADERRVAASSVRNTHAGALRNLERDDELFDVLEAVGKVRDFARRRQLESLRPAA